MGLCSGEGPICPGVSLDLSGDARVEVERFVRLSLSSASWGLVGGLGELPPSCGWPASSSSLSNLSVIKPSVGEVDHAVLEYTPSAFRGGSVRSWCAGGLCRGASRRPSKASLTKKIRKSA
ncbi:hypothetical protein CRG98_034594 [Punica granatum]|uniref:Uncharacterized protein n=1 Tax=Punica granatum TaxID=22663 RepID=A0A2I0ILY6_PUNGR|nr:hypothetical protein CRG98_034594 [Punica granatum]